MAIQFIDLGRNAFDIVVVGTPTKKELKQASRKLLRLLAQGKHCPRFKQLRPAKARLRKQRADGIERELVCADRVGLPALSANDLQQRVARVGCFWRAYADWDLLGWWIQEWTLASINGRRLEVPVLPDGRVRSLMNSHEIRARMGWSQSYLDKIIEQLPGLTKKPGAHGDVFVRTLEFLLAIGTRNIRLCATTVQCA